MYVILLGSNSYEKVKTIKYLGSLLTNQNYIQEEIKYRLKTGNSCYYSVQTLLSSRLISNKNLKIKIYKTIIWPVLLYGCETWSLTLREECRLRVGLLENSILRYLYLGPRGMRTRSGEGFKMRNFIVCTDRLIDSG